MRTKQFNSPVTGARLTMDMVDGDPIGRDWTVSGNGRSGMCLHGETAALRALLTARDWSMVLGKRRSKLRVQR